MHRLKPRLLILRGERSTTFWEETGRAVQKRLPDALVITIQGGTHLLPLEKPDEVAECIIGFFKEGSDD